MMLKKYKEHQDLLAHNKALFDIFEGDLLTYIVKDLQDQFSQETFKEAVTRAAPINVLRRLIDKLSKIYEKAPTREIMDGSESDKKLLTEYVEALDINTVLGGADGANHLFNLFKNTWVKPVLEDGKPCLQVIPSDRFFVIGSDNACPTKPTHYVEVMGKVQIQGLGERTLFYAYTDEEFLAFDDRGDIRTEEMAKVGNTDGVNLVGALPGEYACRSKYNLMPKKDSDTLSMTKLLPVLLTDLNYALKFQTFSTIYTIDVDQTKLKSAPNAIWDLKSDQGSDKPPQVGVIKPDVDSDKALNMIRALFTLWMETRNIKPGSMGQLTTENLASGVSKIIDEMDTSGDRQSQVPFFKGLEERLWVKIQEKYIPYWQGEPEFKLKGLAFSAQAKIKVTFAEQRAAIDTSKAINDQVTKMTNGLETRAGALKALNPDWTEEQVKQKIAEIDAEKKQAQAQNQAQAMPAGKPGQPGQGAQAGQTPAPELTAQAAAAE
jgi:hypothetical protein